MWPCRGTWIPRCSSRRRTCCASGCRTSWPASPGEQGTSSTWATGCCRRRRPTGCARWWTGCIRWEGTNVSTERIGVLLMAYGTPESPDEVEPYLTHIREHYTYIRGDKRPSPEMVADLQARYRLIGGRSPLLDISRAQAEALERRLEETLAPQTGLSFRTYVGMKHWHPFIHDVVRQMAADGVRRAVGIALTAQYSKLSVGGYIHAAQEAIEQSGAPIRMTFVEHWHDRPGFLKALARRVEAARTLFPEAQRADLPVVFTAHNLPAKILEWNDPYPRHMEETARGVAELAGIRRWFVAWQSAGSTPVRWLEPQLPEVL